MANSSNNSSKSTKKQSSSSSSGSKWGLNKISFWLLVATAILYLVAMILAACNINFKVVSALQGVASALMICIVAYLAWKFVSKKPTVWKVLYVVVLLVVIVGIILPLVI